MYKKSLDFIIILAFFLLTGVSAPAADGDVDPLFLTGSSYDDDVLDVALQPNGKLIIAGEFTSIVGAPFRRIARLENNGNLDLSFNLGGAGANGIVREVTLLPDGKILIGGDFTNYNGVAVNRIARLYPDGTLDATFNPGGAGANFSVNRIILQPDNQLLISGGFSYFNGVGRSAVARLSYDGMPDPTFTPTGILTHTSPVSALALQTDGRIIIGGGFFNSETGANNNIARLNADGSLDTAFQSRTGNALSTPVLSIYVRPDGKILIGGNFSSVNGIARTSLALLEIDGSLNNAFNPTGIASVYKFDVQSDGKIVLAGRFPRPQGLDWALMRINADGSADGSFEKNELGTVYSFAIAPDGKIYAGGAMNQTPPIVGAAGATGAKRFNADGTRDISYFTGTGAASGAFTTLVLQDNGKIIILDGLVKRLNPDGTRDIAFNATIGGAAAASSPLDGKVLVGGVGTTAGGVYRIHKLNHDGSIDLSFVAETGSSLATGVSNVNDLASQPDGKVIVVGSFETVNGVARKSLVRLNPDGSVDSSFTPNLVFMEASFRAVTLQPDGKILLAGRVVTVSGATVNAIFRLNPNGTADGTFAVSQTDNTIADIVPQNDGKVLVCGYFNTVNGATRKSIARFNADGSLDASFNPVMFTGSPNYVTAVLPLPSGKILIGGEFFSVNGIARTAIARLNTDGSLDPTITTSVSGSNFPRLYGLARQPDGKVLISGDFRSVNGLSRNNVARLLFNTRKSPFDYDGDGRADLSVFRPSAGSWYISNSSNNAFTATQFGASGDLIAPADFDGDGRTDINVFRPSDGGWYRLNSSNNTFSPAQFGTNGDLPVPGDFDGDGKADLTVYRPSAGSWFRVNSSNNQFVAVQFGITEDKPLVGDFDGDGKSDLTVFRPSNGTWYRISSASDTFSPNQFGAPGDLPVPADYDGDGKTDLAVYRPSVGDWYIIYSSNGSFTGLRFGISEDKPAPADFDGDGKSDPAVWRPSNGTWYLLRTTAGFTGIQFGANEDIPTPHAFVR